MDSDHEHAYTGDDPQLPKPRQLPADLPTSLDDRRHVRMPPEEMEIYDAWQGEWPRMPDLHPPPWLIMMVQQASRNSSPPPCPPSP